MVVSHSTVLTNCRRGNQLSFPASLPTSRVHNTWEVETKLGSMKMTSLRDFKNMFLLAVQLYFQTYQSQRWEALTSLFVWNWMTHLIQFWRTPATDLTVIGNDFDPVLSTGVFSRLSAMNYQGWLRCKCVCLIHNLYNHASKSKTS